MKTFHTLVSSRSSLVLACSVCLLIGSALRAAPPEATQPTAPARETLPVTRTTAQNAVTSVRDALSEAWEKSKDATFKQRVAVRERMKSAEAAIDTKIVEWTAKKDAVVEDARPAVAAAHKEVREAREVLRQKIDALDNATEETWNSVKAELNTAWQRMTTAATDLTAKLQSQS